jgi:hypothetical protein
MKIVSNGLVHEGALFTGVPGLHIKFAVETQRIATRHVNPP